MNQEISPQNSHRPRALRRAHNRLLDEPKGGERGFFFAAIIAVIDRPDRSYDSGPAPVTASRATMSEAHRGVLPTKEHEPAVL